MSTDENSDKYDLCYQLHLAFISVTEILNQELRSAGLDLAHPRFTILQAFFRHPGMSQSELARTTAKDGAAISRSVACLEKRGLLERKWLNGCTKGVFPTDRAEKLRPLLDEAIRKTIDRACARLEDGQITSLSQILQKIRETLSGS